MYFGLGAMLLVWLGARSYWLLALFAVVFGTCYGAYVALLPRLVSKRAAKQALRRCFYVYDWYVCVRNGKVEALWPITARGAVY